MDTTTSSVASNTVQAVAVPPKSFSDDSTSFGGVIGAKRAVQDLELGSGHPVSTLKKPKVSPFHFIDGTGQLKKVSIESSEDEAVKSASNEPEDDSTPHGALPFVSEQEFVDEIQQVSSETNKASIAQAELVRIYHKYLHKPTGRSWSAAELRQCRETVSYTHLRAHET